MYPRFSQPYRVLSLARPCKRDHQTEPVFGAAALLSNIVFRLDNILNNLLRPIAQFHEALPRQGRLIKKKWVNKRFLLLLFVTLTVSSVRKCLFPELITQPQRFDRVCSPQHFSLRHWRGLTGVRRLSAIGGGRRGKVPVELVEGVEPTTT